MSLLKYINTPKTIKIKKLGQCNIWREASRAGDTGSSGPSRTGQLSVSLEEAAIAQLQTSNWTSEFLCKI